MSVGSTHNRGLQQSVVLVNTHQCLHDEGSKAQVGLWGLARSMQQDAVISTQTPVVMLTRTVDTGKWLLVQQHAESVLTGHLLHQ